MAEDLPPPPVTPGVEPPGSPGGAPVERKIMLVLCYLGLLALVPYLTVREADTLRFHARQGLALGILGIGCAGLSLVPFLGFVGNLGLLGVIVLSVIGIAKALGGEAWRMPVAADVADRLNL